MTFRRKNIRLNRNIYEIPDQIFTITICTGNRQRHFEDDKSAEMILSTLETGPIANKTRRYAYCLMPDHLHLMISPLEENLVRIINGWKRFTGNLLNSGEVGGPLWQRGFYDHAVRKEDDIQKAAEYIVNNPVRAGMVNHWEDYPYAWHRWM